MKPVSKSANAKADGNLQACAVYNAKSLSVQNATSNAKVKNPNSALLYGNAWLNNEVDGTAAC